MSVTKKANGIYYYRFMYNGKLYSKSCKTKNKKVAEQIEAKFRLELLQRQELGIKESITLYEALDLLLENINSRKYKSSIPSCIKYIKQYFEDKELHKLTSRDLHVYHSHLKEKYKNSTIQYYFGVIKQAITTAKKHDYLVPDITFPKLENPENRIRIITPEQENKLLDKLDPKNHHFKNGKNKDFVLDNYHFVIIILDTGCRYFEVAKLKWSDINFDKKIIKVWRTKNKIETNLIMTHRVENLLKERFLNKKSDYIFQSRKGGHRRYACRAIIDNMRSIEGLEEFTIHDLRHTCASKLINNGMSLYEVSLILGHKNTDMIRRYAHLINDDVSKKAANVLNEHLDLVDVHKFFEVN